MREQQKKRPREGGRLAEIIPPSNRMPKAQSTTATDARFGMSDEACFS